MRTAPAAKQGGVRRGSDCSGAIMCGMPASRAAPRHGHPVRHAAARGRVAAGPDGGRRPRHVRREVPRRRPGSAGAGRGGRQRRAGPRARAAGAGAGDRRARPGARRVRAGPGGPGPAAAQPGPQPGDRLPARRARPRPGAFAVDPDFAGRVLWFDALVGNVDRSWRNPNMLRLARRAVPDRPRRHADLPPRMAGPEPPGTGAARPYDATAHVMLGAQLDGRAPTSTAPTPRSPRW